MPARTASSTTSWIAGVSTTGSISLGVAFVAGRNRVPRPATGMTAFCTFTRATVLAVAERMPAANRATGKLPAQMPTYEYTCRDCGHTFEIVQSMLGRVADDVPRVRREPAEGVRAAGDLLQGLRLLRDGPREEVEGVRPSRRSDGEKKSGDEVGSDKSGEEGRETKDAKDSKGSKDSSGGVPRSRRSPRRRSRRRRDRRPGGDRRHRRFRLLRLPRGHRDGRGGDAVRGAQRADHDRHGGRPDGRVPPPPRHGSSVPAAPGPLPGEPVGAEGARRHPGVRAVRRGIAAQGDPAADARHQRPGDRLHEVPRQHLLRRPADHARVVRRPVLPDAPRDAREDRRVARDRAPRRRHDGRDRRARGSPPRRSRGCTRSSVRT